jgi:hypothetical protein
MGGKGSKKRVEDERDEGTFFLAYPFVSPFCKERQSIPVS